MSESRELVLPSKAKHAIDLLAQADLCLANARTLGEVIDLRAKAQAAKVWASQFYAKETDLCKSIIEKVSPGPWLEMYGRKLPTNTQWTVYGNQLRTSES